MSVSAFGIQLYDLRSRALPGWDDGPNAANVPSRENVLQALALQAVQALGVALAAWVPDYFRLLKKEMPEGWKRWQMTVASSE